MKNIIVLKTEGKGREGSDFVTVKLFNELKDAQKYCEDNTSEGKYWSFAEIIGEGDRLETWYMENL